VDRIALTHRHPDHTAGAARLSELAGAPVLAFGAGLSDGDVVGGLVAAHTPGHAPEHLCFWHPESRTLLSGDLIAGEGSIMISPPEGDLREYVASLERVRGLSPSRILPGHGPEVARAGEKIEEYLAHRREREARVVAALDSGARSLTEVVESAYAEVSRRCVPPPNCRPKRTSSNYAAKSGRSRGKVRQASVSVFPTAGTYGGSTTSREEATEMSDEAQRRLLTLLVVLTAVLSRPLRNMVGETIPERGGVGDDLAEVVLQGLARVGAVALASVLVRQLSRSRR
jgi:hypothetical protein